MDGWMSVGRVKRGVGRMVNIKMFFLCLRGRVGRRNLERGGGGGNSQEGAARARCKGTWVFTLILDITFVRKTK
jgi:hypothetical protein